MKLAQSLLPPAENARTSSTTPWTCIRGIVFDAVGTLIEPVPSVAEAYTAAARARGSFSIPGKCVQDFMCIFRAMEFTPSEDCCRLMNRRNGGAGG